MENGDSNIARIRRPHLIPSPTFGYSSGLGVVRDYVLAHKWFNIAAVHGSPEARVDRSELALDMTSEEIAEAQRLAREWTTTH